MTDNNINLQTDSVVVPAGQTIPRNITGSFILNKSSTGNLIIQFAGTEGAFNELDKYRLPYGARFGTVYFYNPGASDVSITYAYGDGDIESGGLRITGIVEVAGGGTRSHGAATVGIAAAAVMAANSTRTGWIVQNLGTASIYLGKDNTVTTANGIEVPPGGSFSWDDQDAVWAISGTAGQDVRYSEVQS